MIGQQLGRRVSINVLSTRKETSSKIFEVGTVMLPKFHTKQQKKKLLIFQVLRAMKYLYCCSCQAARQSFTRRSDFCKLHYLLLMLLHMFHLQVMASKSSRDAFNCFIFSEFSTRNIPVVVAVTITPSLIGSSINTTRLYIRVFIIIWLNFEHTVQFQWFYRLLLFLELFFVPVLGRSLVICTKYTSTYGQHANASARQIQLSLDSVNMYVFKETGSVKDKVEDVDLLVEVDIEC